MNHLTEKEFTRHLLEIAEEERRLTKKSSQRWKDAVLNKGGVQACEDLMASYPDHMSDGFTRLLMEQRPDLTVEAQMVKHGQRLFDTETLQWAADGVKIIEEHMAKN